MTAPRPGASVLSIGPLRYRLPAGAWLTPAAAHYAISELWDRVSGGAPYNGPVRIEMTGTVGSPDLEALAVPTALLLADVLPPGAHLGIDAEALPVLFGEPSAPRPLEEGRLTLGPDLVALTFFMLSRWEETTEAAGDGAERDERGRFPAQQSVAFRAGFLDRPVVDEWALVIRAWLRHLDPSWSPLPGVFRVHLTHDVDTLRRTGSVGEVARTVAGALRRREWDDVVRQLRNGVAALSDWQRDAHVQGMRELMDLSEAAGLPSAFYFKTSDRGPYDTGYRLGEGHNREVLAEVEARGHEVGWHPGYRTFDDPVMFDRELARFEQAVGRRPSGGRQHNLRFQPSETWRRWAEAGLTYDSTVGYAERAGFRCGTSHPFRTFDLDGDRVLSLVEVPLVVMETTLFSPSYEGIEAGAALSRALELAGRSQAVSGVFVLLWHNSSFEGSYRQWSRIYPELVRRLQALDETTGPTPLSAVARLAGTSREAAHAAVATTTLP